MQVAVLGAGKMGQAAVYLLSRRAPIDRVLVIDRDERTATKAAEVFGNNKTVPAVLDVADGTELRVLLADCEVALGAVSYRYNVEITQACIDTRTHFCDLGGNHTVVETQFSLSAAVAESGIAVIPDCGLAPGLVNILTARLLQSMPDAHTIRIRVGGLPLRPTPPFYYHLVFSAEGLLNEYREPTRVLREGKLVEVETLGELEELSFPPPFTRLEAFHTSGGISTLPQTMQERVDNLDYKTIRYPGHRDLIRALFALGLADEQPELIDRTRIIPRRVLEHHLGKYLKNEGPDVVLVLVEALGPQGRRALRIIHQGDGEHGLSAMMQCTSFPAAIIAHMLACGEIGQSGTLYQESSIPIQPFFDRLAEAGISLIEE
ncbi:MAG: saccharopine dehydrogenase NADP-binding domain-containing protein [Bradymonadales bacterium]|nr:saccharopine dehydrogenase NADP-binding domain-containing protein [Bradymonadales bacterium]